MTTTVSVDRAHILAAVIRSTQPRHALPTIASNAGITLAELQGLLNEHGFPDKNRMREEWRRLIAAQDDDQPAASSYPASVPRPGPPPAAKRDPYVTAVPVADLFADSLYQRELDERRVQRMVTAYDQALVGIIEISDRGPGASPRYAILDGQHRWAAYRDHCFDTSDSPHIAARVHTGLRVAEEAELYHRLNTTRKQLTGWDRWLARRTSGDQDVLDIETATQRHGYTIGTQVGPSILRATRACENVVALGGIALLDETLSVVRAAYGDDQNGLDGAILHGLAHVLHAYSRDELDLARLINALAGIVPRQLTARAASVRELHKGTTDRLTAHVIVERYNAEKGRNLESFFTRVKPTHKAKPDASTRRNAAIREWAERRGTPVTSQRIPRAVRDAYDSAHPTQDPS